MRFATLLNTRPMEFFLVIFSTSSAEDSGSESTPATCTTGTNGDKISIGMSSTGVHGTDDSGVVVADDDADGQPSEIANFSNARTAAQRKNPKKSLAAVSTTLTLLWLASLF